MSTTEYIERSRTAAEANLAQIELIKRQWSEATEYIRHDRPLSDLGLPHMTVSCGCGRRMAIECLFRCFFCGVFFCEKCAREHFGEEDHHPAS
jgi:hypothetical protein